MRILACIIMIGAVAACGGETEQNVAAPKADHLSAGLWELTSEVTAFQTVDQGEPKIDTPVGTQATEQVCVGGEGRPPSALFTGEGYRCNFDNYYLRSGTINVTLQCAREGLDGMIPISAAGNFEADSLEYSRQVRTVLSGDGDVQITQRVTGRRAGDCPPDAAGDNQANAQDGEA